MDERALRELELLDVARLYGFESAAPVIPVKTGIQSHTMQCITQYQNHYPHSRIPGDHSALAPLLPIPNRTVKRRRADDIADCP